MPAIQSREIRLASRPKAYPTATNFNLAQIELGPLPDGQVLVRNLFMSVDPYMRLRMNDAKSYVPPFELGKTLEGGAIGEVIESRTKDLQPGDAVISHYGWREFFIASPETVHPVSREIQPLSAYLGALTMKGLMVLDWLDRQAEFEKEVGGLIRAGKVRHKETVVEGIDHAVDAFLGLFQGQNVGKLVVKLA